MVVNRALLNLQPCDAHYYTMCFMSSLFSLPLDVSCQIWGARGSSLSVGGVKPANLFLGNDIRNPVSRASLLAQYDLQHI